MQEIKKYKKILIEVNQTCNLNCTYCFYRDYGRTKQSLSIDDIITLLDRCSNIEEFYLTGGECFTSPIIDSIIELLSKKGKVIPFTNGIMLNKYDDKRLKGVVDNVERFIITFDSFDIDNYKCRSGLSETINTIKRILELDPNKLEVKVCINKYNYQDLEMIFSNLVNMGVKYLSVNFVFDINNSNISHEIKQLRQLKQIFEIIGNYKDYFNDSYIEMLHDLYINDKINKKFPCIADREYFFLDSLNNYLICPGNCKQLGHRGDWKECFSKECANEWEMMYTR